METESSPDTLAIPPDLIAAIKSEAEAEHRSAGDVLRELVEKGLRQRHSQKIPAYVQERAATLGLTEGGTPRRLVRKVSEMSAAELEAIGNTEMDARHNHLDAELK